MGVLKSGIVTSNKFSESYHNIYDTTVYAEPDNSAWIRICHHNNPASVRFNSTDDFEKPVYLDTDRWFNAAILGQITNNVYELMIKQKAATTSTEAKYRWIQSKNPYVAVFGDVDPADVTKITTSGYSNNTSYGGIYKKNANAYFTANNGTSNNWWGAIGSWTDYSGGLPGYAQTKITTGYIDLYIRIDNHTLDLASVFTNDIQANQFYEL